MVTYPSQLTMGPPILKVAHQRPPLLDSVQMAADLTNP